MPVISEIMYQQMEVFLQGRDILVSTGIPYVVGGGLAVGCYGHQRPTKDIDFMILPEDAEEALEALHDGGFRIKRSDPDWLYQSWKGETLVDLVFRINTSHGRISIDPDLIDRGSEQMIFGHRFHVAAPEDLIIFKVLVQHENRSDWWDAITILRNRNLSLNWENILRYAGMDPVKVLSFLLFTISRHTHEHLIPDWVLQRTWISAAHQLNNPILPTVSLFTPGD